MPTPTAHLLLTVNGGAPTSGGITAVTGDVIQLSAMSTIGWSASSTRWEITGFPAGFALPSGWSSVTADGHTIYYWIGNTNPPPFTLGTWGKYMLRLLVNGGGGAKTDISTAIEVLSTNGLHDLGHDEEGQFGGSAEKWAKHARANLRVIDAALAAAGGSVSDITDTAPIVVTETSPGVFDVAINAGVAATANYVVQRNASGEVEQRLNAVGETAALAASITNATTSTGPSPQWSGIFGLQGREASVSDRAVWMGLQTRNAGETSPVKLSILSKLGAGAWTEVATIDGLGAVAATSMTLVSFVSAPSVYATNVFGTDSGSLNVEVGSGSMITVKVNAVTVATITGGEYDIAIPLRLPTTAPTSARQVSATAAGRLQVYVAGAARELPTFADVPQRGNLPKTTDSDPLTSELAESTVFTGSPYDLVGAIVQFFTNAALTADDTNYATFTVRVRAPDGTLVSTATAVSTTTGDTGDWTAFVPVILGASLTVDAGNIVTVQMAKVNGGVSVPSGQFDFYGSRAS
jgi:hypothetical protein